jgi:hypothetical protein
VTVTNISGDLLQGPISLVLDHLGRKVKVLNRTGVTLARAPSGSPYKDVSSSLASGASAIIVLQFSSSMPQQIHYAPRLLAGAGPR